MIYGVCKLPAIDGYKGSERLTHVHEGPLGALRTKNSCILVFDGKAEAPRRCGSVGRLIAVPTVR